MDAMEWSRVRRLLVARLDNLGDVLLCSPALRTIKHHLSDAHVTLLASPGGSRAAALLPWVDDVLTWRPLWQDVDRRLPLDPRRELRLVALLREGSYDAAVILTSFAQSALPLAYLCLLAGVPWRIGFFKERCEGVLRPGVPAPPDHVHQAERNLGLLEGAGLPAAHRHLAVAIPEAAREGVRDLLASVGVRPPYLVLTPGASCSSRVYPWQRYAQVARRLVAETAWPVLVTGDERDADLARRIGAEAGPGVVPVAGRTSVPELAALVAGASGVLTNNTATMHLADALDVPTVVLFAGTELESQWRPRRAPHRLLRVPTPCSPCYRFSCPYDGTCLDIAPEAVVRTMLQVLEARNR